MPASASPGHGKRQPGAFQVKSGPSNLQVYVQGAGEPMHVTGGLLLRRSPRQDAWRVPARLPLSRPAGAFSKSNANEALQQQPVAIGGTGVIAT